jgi:hypothetical protein
MPIPGSYLLVEGHRLQRFPGVPKTKSSILLTIRIHQIQWRVTGLPTTLDAFNAIPRRYFSARECLPRYQYPLPSSKNFASALLNSFPHSQKRQFRWKHCNSSPVFELPSDISPLPLLIDLTFPGFTRPFIRPPLLMFYQQ